MIANFLTIIILCCVLYTIIALTREEIDEKIHKASNAHDLHNADSPINVQAKFEANRNAQRIKQDRRNAIRQNKKDLRNARKKRKRGEL